MKFWRRDTGYFLVLVVRAGFGFPCSAAATTMHRNNARSFSFLGRMAAPRLSVTSSALFANNAMQHQSSRTGSGVGDGRSCCFATSNYSQSNRSNEIIMRHGQQTRRRRGAIISRKRPLPSSSPLMGSNADNDVEQSSLSSPLITQYTINDSVCPPTDPETLTNIVRKHIRTLPRYWKSRPIAKHTAAAFEEALEFVMNYGEKNAQLLQLQLQSASAAGEKEGDYSTTTSRIKVILDSGCGTGKSSHLLGEMHPDCVVIGIDQSLARLSRNKSYNNQPDDDEWFSSDGTTAQSTSATANNNANNNNNNNVLLLRAELSDFWKCCLSSPQWKNHVEIHKHYLLYPNPYPKKKRLGNRFYAHPAFPLLMMATLMRGEGGGGNDGGIEEDGEKKTSLVVRSNWKGYLQEFKAAAEVWSRCGGSFDDFHAVIGDEVDDGDEWHPKVSEAQWETFGPEQLYDGGNESNGRPLTNFEAKFLDCGEPIYELSLSLKKAQ